VGELREVDAEGNSAVVQPVTRVEIPEMAAIIRGIARGTIRWQREPYFGTEAVAEVEGEDLGRFDFKKFYTQEQIERLVEALRQERREYLASFENLEPVVASAFA